MFQQHYVHILYHNQHSPVGWGSRIHWLHLCRKGKDPSPNKCPVCNTKQSDGKALVMLELWGMRSTPSLPSLPGPLWPRVVAPDSLIYWSNRTVWHLNWEQTNDLCKIELFRIMYIYLNVCKQMTDVKLWLLYSNT